MTDAEHSGIAGHSVILYDGVCGLCNRVVQRLLRLDRAGHLRFVPLKSPLGIEMLGQCSPPPALSSRPEPEGVILIADALTPHQKIYRRFDAVGRALRRIPGPYPALGALLRLVPRFLREWVYSIIARNRYRIFGRFESCPIPTPDQRSRILGIYNHSCFIGQ